MEFSGLWKRWEGREGGEGWEGGSVSECCCRGLMHTSPSLRSPSCRSFFQLKLQTRTHSPSFPPFFPFISHTYRPGSNRAIFAQAFPYSSRPSASTLSSASVQYRLLIAGSK